MNQPHLEGTTTITSEREFLDLAEALLYSVETCCDHINDTSDTDIDAQRVGGMITLVFANRSEIVINTQKPLFEIWLAAKSGGFHYRYKNGYWYDSKSKCEFFSDLSRFASVQAGCSVQFEQVQ